MQIINFTDFNILNQLFIEFLNFKSEHFYLALVYHIIFTYKLIDINLYTNILKSEHKIKGVSSKEKIDTF